MFQDPKYSQNETMLQKELADVRILPPGTSTNARYHNRQKTICRSEIIAQLIEAYY